MLHFARKKRQASLVDPLLLITHLGAAIGGVIIGARLARLRR